MKRRTVAVGAAVALTLVAGALTLPNTVALSSATSGDDALIAQVRDALPAGPFDRLSIAVIDGDDISIANFGADDETEYEIGSVTKTFTASLYAIALERGEVEKESTLGELLGVAGAASSITLEQLATQHSGLPRLPDSPDLLLRAALANLSGSDPYVYDLAALVGQASSSKVDDEHPFEYSNFGFALLGQALAAAADTTYDELVKERVLSELGMTHTFAPAGANALPADAPTGYSATGRPADAWTMDAYGPAGSIRATLDDMVDYVIAQRDDTAPGVDATTPRLEVGESEEIGYAWFTTEDGVTWHNGMTGGFSSFVAFDRDTDRAVVILNNSAVSLDDLGFDLVGGER